MHLRPHFIGSWRRVLELPVRVSPPLLAVTTNEIPGYQIVRVHGDVLGLTVRAFSSFGVRLQTVALGEADTTARSGPKEPSPEQDPQRVAG
jgi:hypothetical protein